MKFRWLCVVGLFIASAPTLPADSLDADRAVAKQLAADLKAALATALKNSPESAIAVCNDRAPSIAARLATESNAKVGRTALRVRNSDNAPTEWQRAVLLDFANRMQAGESAASIEFSADVMTASGIEHRYMKAIPVEPLCVTCHGSQLPPSLREAIRSKYPADAATGFKVGDLRGAVYVVRRPRR